VDHPDQPTNISLAHAGEIQAKPEKIISVVVTNKENDPVGVLEKWNADAWIYAKTDSLIDIN
jgi:hypothetical protein